jgi:hypothetical protein
MGNPLKKLGKAVEKGVRKVGDFVVENAPVIAAVVTIIAPGVGTAIGNALLPAAAANTAAAAAAGAAAISSGLTALNPNATGKDILRAGAAAGAGTYAGSVVGPKVSSAVGGTTGRVAGAAAGGGAGATTGAIVQGAEPDEALRAGLRGAATAGLVQTGVEGVRGLSAQGPQQAGEARLRVPGQSEYQRGQPIANAPTVTGATNRVPTGGGQGLVGDTSSLYRTNLIANPTELDPFKQRLAAPGAQFRATEAGVQPAYQTGESLITPLGMQFGSPVYRDRPDFVPPSLTRREEDLLKESLGEAFGYLFRGQPQEAPESPTQLGATRRLGAPLTQASPGSQALAQALRIGDAGAPVFGGEREEGRRSGWNVESLRYMGNSEA